MTQGVCQGEWQAYTRLAITQLQNKNMSCAQESAGTHGYRGRRLQSRPPPGCPLTAFCPCWLIGPVRPSPCRPLEWAAEAPQSHPHPATSGAHTQTTITRSHNHANAHTVCPEYSAQKSANNSKSSTRTDMSEHYCASRETGPRGIHEFVARTLHCRLSPWYVESTARHHRCRSWTQT
jgi:hypothetical protein